MKKLFDNGELGSTGWELKSRTASENNLVLPWSLLAEQDGGINAPSRKKPSRSWIFWTQPSPVYYQPRKTIRMASESLKMNSTLLVSVPDSESGQQLAPHIELERNAKAFKAGKRWNSLNFSRRLLSLVSGDRRLKAMGENAVQWRHYPKTW